MLKNWMILILFILVILTNLWREHQVEATMERGEQRYEQAVREDEQKIATLQAEINSGLLKCYTRQFRAYKYQYCVVENYSAK